MQAEDDLLYRLGKSGVQMKLSLVFLIILFLTLGTVACSGSPVAQKEAEGSVDANPSLARSWRMELAMPEFEFYSGSKLHLQAVGVPL